MASLQIKEKVKEDPSDRTASVEDNTVINERYRQEEFNTAVHYIRVISLWLFAGLVMVGFTAMTVVWLIHLLTSTEFRWLEANDLLQIKAILIGVFLGGVSSFLTNALLKPR